MSDLDKLKRNLGYVDESPRCKSCRSFAQVDHDTGLCSTALPWTPAFEVSANGYCQRYFSITAFNEMKARVESLEKQKEADNERHR